MTLSSNFRNTTLATVTAHPIPTPRPAGKLLQLFREQFAERLKAWIFRSPRFVDGLALAAVAVVGLVAARRLLLPGFPPGVDTPTFLHLSWFTRETLQGAGGWVDPYWYGGFRPFTTYPPLSYSLVGALAAMPGVGFVFVYKTVLLAAYVGTGIATYFLARQLGNARSWSALAGVLTVLAYPLMVAVGLWGWFSSVVALPLALVALALLERAYSGGRIRWAAIGGVTLGLSVLAHHMTAFAFALGLPGWFLFCYLGHSVPRRHLYRVTALFGLATVASILWWVVPWAINLIQAGFQRETPGLWSFPITQYLGAITQRDLIGLYAYPNYLGLGLIAMAIGGAVQSFLVPSRHTPYAILLVVLVAFSLGEQANPLLRVRPFDGLDVARFGLYMAPVIALVGVPFLASAGTAVVALTRLRRPPTWLPGAVGGLLVALVLGLAMWDGAVASQRLFGPYRVTPAMQQALEWFGKEEHQGKELGVGFWHWDDFLLPYYLRRAVVDGWHDEGARNWRTVRALRIMMWTGKVDIPQAYQLLDELGGRYLAVQDYFTGESPDKFRAALEEHPELFSKVADWGEVTIYERVPKR
ncbi:MAG: hypothetical protein Q7K03_05870 [Dehalococcoidia bacterium]|nr:hypothetical protein [Dehalococcoidia bacterium]